MKTLTQTDIEDTGVDDQYAFEQYAEIKIIGQITTDLLFYLHIGSFDVVDISEAEFVESDDEVRLDYVTPDGCPMYGTKTRVQHFDYLEMFVRDILTEKIILPPNVKRKHINRIKNNNSIKEVVVVEDCELFCMKDGNVYNKKGTTLVYKNNK